MALILPNTISNLIPADGDKLQQNFETIQDWANQDAISADGSTAMVAPLLLPGPPTQTNQAATKGYVDASVPVGVIWMTAADTAADGWMMCRGQAISRASYAALFNAIGTRFGSGDGSTTFNLPDYQGTYPVGHNSVLGGLFNGPVGERAGTALATMPSHTHVGADHVHPTGATTAGQSNNHYHLEQLGSIIRQATGTPQFYVHVTGGGGFDIASEFLDTSGTSTNWAAQDHTHAIPGNTGAADRILTTSASGGDPTNGNLPPSMALNFIIRVS